jgi:hypothetical protein
VSSVRSCCAPLIVNVMVESGMPEWVPAARSRHQTVS